ncbi:MAG: sterol desaturase family protein [Halioglobus sp.]|nr:sterol desaturase family protein [Halioglobus sp.]
MQALWTEYFDLLTGTFAILFLAYLSLLFSWPIFLLMEKISPVMRRTPRSNYLFNWKITGSNLLLAPAFNALIILATIALIDILGLPRLSMSTGAFSVGIPFIDLLLQGILIFFVACFLGDFSYYWWHRAQHKVPFLWEMHKLHHSDESLNTTTIYRSHFLEPAGQSLVRGLTIGLIFDVTETPQTVLAIVAGGLLPVLWDYFIHANVRFDALNRILPFFSVPQYHWIHHSREPEHQDRNFAIWLPMFDIAFGSYYRPRVDEYPRTGLSTGEKIENLWDAQAGPIITWAGLLGRKRSHKLRQTSH